MLVFRFCRVEGCFLVQSVLDTGANCSVLSKQVFNSLDNPPPVKRKLLIHAAGENQSITAKVVGPLKIQIGKAVLNVDMAVAPIRDKVGRKGWDDHDRPLYSNNPRVENSYFS